MNIHWSDDALADIQVVQGTLTRTSPGYARDVAARIYHKVEVLTDMPLFGATVPEEDDDDLRELFEHPYRIIYRVHPDRVVIAAIIHSAPPSAEGVMTAPQNPGPSPANTIPECRSDRDGSRPCRPSSTKSPTAGSGSPSA